MAAVALAGCGEGGSVAGQISTAGAGVTGARPTVTQTRESATVDRTAPVTTTEGQSVATVTETQPRETVTEEATTAVTVTASGQPTVQAPTVQTTTVVIAPATTTAAAAMEEDSTSPWVWVLVAVGAALLIALVAWLVRKSSQDRRLAEQERAVAATVAGWIAQGWAIESQTSRSAVLRQHGERVAVSVEPDGSITSRRLAGPDE